MAEKRTFKYGDSEYLLDDLLKLHAEQENNFYTFARERGAYDDLALQGLRTAVANRINAVKSGLAFEGDGVLATDLVDNITIKRKALRKKDRYVDQDNTEWAKYYFNKLVGSLSPYTKTATAGTGDWDITKHGFSTYLNENGFRASDISSNYDKKDKKNPKNPRGFSERQALLAEQLPLYRDWLQKQGFDFTKNSNLHDDNFLTQLSDFITGYGEDISSVSINNLRRALRQFGAGDDYTNAFTATDWAAPASTSSSTPGSAPGSGTKTKEQLKAEQDAKNRKLYVDRMNEYNRYAHSRDRAKYATHNFIFLPYLDDNGNPFEDYSSFLKWYTKGNPDLKFSTLQWQKDWGNFTKYLRESAYTWDNTTNTYSSARPVSEVASLGISDLRALLQGSFLLARDSHFVDLGNDQFLIKESVNSDGLGFTYNPQTGLILTIYLGDYGNNPLVYPIYSDLAHDWIYNKYKIDYRKPPEITWQKDGGQLIEIYQKGSSINYDWEGFYSRDLSERANNNGITVEQQKAWDKPTTNSKKAEFSAADKVRLASIAADVTSLFLPQSVGLALGLGSTVANFGADIADDGFQLADVGNAAVGLGFDMLGAIPIIGDAVGTGTKILRGLTKYAPRIAAFFAVQQGISNADGIVESFNKIIKDGTKARLTVEDWRNIAQGIGLATGTGRWIKNKTSANSTLDQTKVKDAVGISVKNKNTGEIEHIIVEGDVAAKIKNAKGDITTIEAELNKLDLFKGNIGATGDFELDTRSVRARWLPWHKVPDVDGTEKWKFGFSDEKPKITEIYDFSKLRTNRFTLYYPNAIAKANQSAVVSPEFSKQKASIEAELTAKTNQLKTDIEAAKTSKANIDVADILSKHDALSLKLDGLNETNVLSELTGMKNKPADMTQLEADLSSIDTDIKSLEAQLQAKNIEADVIASKTPTNAVERARQSQDFDKVTAEVADLLTKITNQKTLYSTLELKLTNIKLQRAVRQTELEDQKVDFEKLKKYKDQLSEAKPVKTKETLAYEDLLNFIKNKSTVGKHTMIFDLDAILKKADIPMEYELGGAINRNKMNKFLNYARKR